jgi:hypothetical protein
VFTSPSPTIVVPLGEGSLGDTDSRCTLPARVQWVFDALRVEALRPRALAHLLAGLLQDRRPALRRRPGPRSIRRSD